MRLARWSVILAILTSVQLPPRTASGVEASDTLVLYNLASSEGTQIANYYASVYPGVQLLGLSGIGTSENITADDYLNTLRPQVLAALTPDIDLLVTTDGMPLRIQVTQAPVSAYTDPFGIPRTVISWKPYSSLESELALIDMVSTYEMMGDQSYAFPGHFTRNPYYNAAGEFSYNEFGTRLTARLDGYSVDDVTDAIDRAQNVFVGPPNSPAGPMHFVVDNDPARPYDLTMTRLVDDVLGPAGVPLTYDNTSAFVGTAPGPVIGYDSHGVHQGLTPADYITDGIDFTLADGAVFTSLESFNAFSFNEGGYNGAHGQVAQWLEIGGTAGVGFVEEPMASWVTVSNEDILFKNLLAGKTFAEAAWAANYQVSYVNTMVGDPLMVWRVLGYGDVNMDGFIDISDLAIMGAHWDETYASGGYGWTFGDVNGDGAVDISDLAILGANWGATSPWATGAPSTGDISPSDLSTAIQAFIHPTPEPSGLALLALGAAALLAYRRRARPRLGRQHDRART